MADPAAVAAAAAAANTPPMNVVVAVPLWDPVIFGNPFYIWLILIFFALLMIGLVAFKLEVYDRLKPVWGMREADIKNIPLAILREMSGKISLIPVTNVANIFIAMGLPLKWIQTVATQGQMGRCNTIDISDDWNIVRNVDVDYAIVHAVHKWNEANPEGTKGFIYDWETFEEHLLNGDLDAMFPDGIKLPPFRVVNLHEIRKYLPKWTASAHAGYISAEIEKRKPENMEEQGRKYMMYMFYGAVALGIAGVFVYLILTSLKCPVCT